MPEVLENLPSSEPFLLTAEQAQIMEQHLRLTAERMLSGDCTIGMAWGSSLTVST